MKFIVPIKLYSTRNRKFQKKKQKKSKNYWTLLGLLFKPKQVGKGQEREKLKIIVPFNFYPTSDKKFQKHSKN